MHLEKHAYLQVRAYRRFHKLSADGLSQVNINLCHHSRIHNVIYFRCVHHLFLFRYILHIILFTNIHNLSISLPHSLSLSPIYLSLALFRHVHCHSSDM